MGHWDLLQRAEIYNWINTFSFKEAGLYKQEIWASLILFNFCHAIIAETVPRHVKPNKKHIYQINISRAICICRQFLAAKEKAPPDIESLISRELLPIRTGRSDPRKVKTQSAVSFLYRIAWYHCTLHIAKRQRHASFICMSFLEIFWNCKESNRPVGHIVPAGLLLFLLSESLS